MDTHYYFLIQIKLAKTVDEIHGYLVSTSFTPALASPTSKDEERTPIMAVLLWRRKRLPLHAMQYRWGTCLRT
ncbi:Hypothetical protein FKW44_018718 [Caligus rogercresseyi]|uniref:Uncharacterized protein n=1 Tax=Caligus rogercresseyi TaxID=217165 RepID=A0A7T8GV85_CALRO|nr:Hypothetical protein FKW44_018718 [Caligus rogercresseyi]